MKIINIGGIEMELTTDRQRRIVEAVNDTQRQIDREMGYSEEFRKYDNIARWKQHVANLQNMLKGA
jgi:hypothetical protein